MTDEEIIEAAREAGLLMRRPICMVEEGDTIRFTPSTKRTPAEDCVIAFVRQVQAAERARAATLAMPESAGHCIRELRGRCNPAYAASEAIHQGIRAPDDKSYAGQAHRMI